MNIIRKNEFTKGRKRHNFLSKVGKSKSTIVASFLISSSLFQPTANVLADGAPSKVVENGSKKTSSGKELSSLKTIEIKIQGDNFIVKPKDEIKNGQKTSEKEALINKKKYPQEFYELTKKLKSSEAKGKTLKLEGKIYAEGDLSFLFKNAKLSNIGNLSELDTSNVTNMRGMFYQSEIEGDINSLKSWDVSNVTNMQNMFSYSKFTGNLDGLASWNTKKVTDMSGLFNNSKFNSDINGLKKWDVSNVTNMQSIFAYSNFTGTLEALKDWKVDKVDNMYAMFRETKFTGTLEHLKSWNVSSVKSMGAMFANSNLTGNLEALNTWDTSKVNSMTRMFGESKFSGKITFPEKFSKNNAADFSNMFEKSLTRESVLKISDVDFKDNYVENMFNETKGVIVMKNISNFKVENTDNKTIKHIIVTDNNAILTAYKNKNFEKSIKLKFKNNEYEIKIPSVFELKGSDDEMKAVKDTIDKLIKEKIKELKKTYPTLSEDYKQTKEITEKEKETNTPIYLIQDYTLTEAKTNTKPILEVVDKQIKVGEELDLKSLITRASDKEDVQDKKDEKELVDKVKIEKGNFDNKKAGQYEITYTLTDNNGESVSKRAKVTVKQNIAKIEEAPILEVENKTILQGEDFNLKDLIKNPLEKDSVTIEEDEGFNKDKVGTYTITFKVKNKIGITTYKKAKVTVNPKKLKLNEIPVLQVIDKQIKAGENLDLKSLITKASDKEDGDNLIDKVEIDQKLFDNKKAGEYKIKYTLTDSKGASITKEATVLVVETKKPDKPLVAEEKEKAVTTEYEDEKGNVLKQAEIGTKKQEIKEIKGYKFKKEEQTQTGYKYIYEKIKEQVPNEAPKQEEKEKAVTTEYEDEHGNKLKETIFDTKKQKQQEIKGYKFKREEQTQTGYKYIYEKIKEQVPDKAPKQEEKEKAVTTEYEDERGNVLKQAEIGTKKQEIKEIKGYKFKKEEQTQTGYKYIYEKIETKKPDVSPVPTPKNTSPQLEVINKEIQLGEILNLKDLIIKATDKEDGDLKDKVEITDKGGFDNSKVGTYKIIYKVTDSAGLSVEKEAIVRVKEKAHENGNNIGNEINNKNNTKRNKQNNKINSDKNIDLTSIKNKGGNQEKVLPKTSAQKSKNKIDNKIKLLSLLSGGALIFYLLRKRKN